MFNRRKFGKRLQIARRRAGYTQEHVGQILDVCRVEISKYENGVVIPGINRVCEMANLYGCSIDWLCGVKEEARWTS